MASDRSLETASHERAPSATNASVSSQSSTSLSNRIPSGYTIPDPASVEEHGRTFNAYREGKYFLPNDALEQERLDLAHDMWRLIMDDDLSWAPFEDEPVNVLDIGTGTGIWAIEFAQQHPASHVVGTDISMIQPPPESIPSNCSFERDDVEEEWVFDRVFDYIHLRAMLTCFNDHVGVLQRIYNNLRPGGWVEYHEYLPEIFGKDDVSQQAMETSAVFEWSERAVRGAARFGRDMKIARQYKQLLINNGFVDVVEKKVLAPNNPWPTDPRQRRIGQYMQANTLELLGAVSIKMLQGDGMTMEQIEEYIPRVRESVLDPSLHLYSTMYIVYGRKPFEAENTVDLDDPDKHKHVDSAQVISGTSVSERTPHSTEEVFSFPQPQVEMIKEKTKGDEEEEATVPPAIVTTSDEQATLEEPEKATKSGLEETTPLTEALAGASQEVSKVKIKPVKTAQSSI
ncbi:S-adenosyl-L-methionine-dependent methyltransferase [Xylariales sp. PMI_506]|nr:S-adenosyl-L-methionine-dependent methyltransferase [Xylariales sp. PMI_506]